MIGSVRSSRPQTVLTSALTFAALAACAACLSESSDGAGADDDDASVTQALTSPIGSTEGFLGESGVIHIRPHGCGPGSFGQIPGHLDYFIGRNDVGGGCGAPGAAVFEVGLFKMDWATHELNLVGHPFPNGTHISDGRVVTTGYDPSAAEFNGEIWVAWECNLGACAGPFNPTTGKIDPARTNTPISGQIPGSHYSASVPGLFAFKGHLYLYWTAVRRDPTTLKWIDAASRGAELTQESGGLRRLWVKGEHASVPSISSSTKSVWSLGSDNLSNVTADLMGDVFTDGQHVFGVAALGGLNCKYPDSTGTVTGCYRMAISRSLSPLATGMLGGGELLPAQYLPSAGIQYTRLTIFPDGKRYLMGGFGQGWTGGEHPLGTSGTLAIPLPDDASYFKVAPPTSGVREISVTFDQLHNLDGDCTSATIHSSGCVAASARACRESFGYAAGYGPVEASNGNAVIVCMASDLAKAANVPFATLDNYIAACTSPAAALSVSCDAAVSRYCTHEGHVTGSPIMEHSATEASLACLDAPGAHAETVPWAKLTAEVAGCTFASGAHTPESCMTAARRYCRHAGYVSGFGVQEVNATAGQVTCLAN